MDLTAVDMNADSNNDDTAPISLQKERPNKTSEYHIE